MSLPLTARERLERAIAMVPWIASHPEGASVHEICARFDLDVDQLHDCLNTVFMVGVHPYTPDAMIDVFIESDLVTIRLPDYFTRPIRLTPTQTFGLLAAGRALQSIPGADESGPLARALAKIASAHGATGDHLVAVDISTAPTEVYDDLSRAVVDQRCVRIDYYTHGRDQSSVRIIEPWLVGMQDGYWYVKGYCRAAEGIRNFRLDRVRSLEVLDEQFTPPDTIEPLEPFRADGLPRVTLDLGPSSSWVASQYPVDEVIPLDDSRLRVTLAVGAVPWLERLLLRLGPDAVVVSSDPALTGVGPDAARRVRSVYVE